jgi:hypothetical protein
LEESWTFQGKKKHKVKITTTCPAIDHPSQLDAPPAKVLGEKRGKKQSKLHHSFFESLGILLSERAKQCKTRIWPILTREKKLTSENPSPLKKTKPC